MTPRLWAGPTEPAAPAPPTGGVPTPTPSTPAPPPTTTRPADRPLTPDDDFAVRQALAGVLVGAAELVGERGLRPTNGTTATPPPDEPVDVLTAIAEAARLRGHRLADVARVQAMSCVLLVQARVGRGLEAWNDEPWRTGQDVVDVLYATAEGVLRA